MSGTEALLADIYLAAKRYGDVALFAGEELEVDAELGAVRPTDEALVSHMLLTSTVTQPEYYRVRAVSDGVLYRSAHASVRLGLG